MSILNIITDVTGQVGTVPQEIYINTDDTLATVTTAGYLNQMRSQGYSFSNNQLAHVYGIDFNHGNPGCLDFQVSVPSSSLSGNYSLVLISTGTTGTVTSVGTGGPLSGGPITTTGTVTVANNAITYGYLQQGTASRIIGNPTGSTANLSEISLDSQSMQFSGTSLQTKLRSNAGITKNSFGMYIDPQYLSIIQTVVSSAEVLNLSAAPVLVVNASTLPSGNAIFIDSIVVQMQAMTTQYAAGSNLTLVYGTPSVPNSGILASTPVANTVVNGQTNTSCFTIQGGLSSVPSPGASLRPANIYLTVDGADFTTGDGTMVLFVRFYIAAIL